MRTVVCLLAVLLALTPVTQALAQAEQPEQESDTTETSKPSVPTTLFPSTDGEPAFLPVPAVEPDTVPLVRLEAASIFPITDSPAAYDSAAATPAPAAISTAGWVVIGVLIAVVVLFGVILIACSIDNCYA